ncbi:MAG: flagellar assembly protein T N-terminal domain-containing protein, partial [Proteobacteria bacterium]|nr:flagellar assembly protein T N-terminal domain-containing protein [Pseudomonadota bacterium]
EVAPTEVVEAEGSALVTGGDLARARNEAVREALQKAVEQVAGHWLTLQDSGDKSPALKERITDQAEGFIQEYRIVSETTVLDVHTVAVRASVLAENLRKDLVEIGLVRPIQPELPVIRISLTIRGIHAYGDYVKCRAVLRDRIPGIREIILREAAWGLARFDIAAEGTVPVLSARLQEKLAVDLQYQDDRILEVHLR